MPSMERKNFIKLYKGKNVLITGGLGFIGSNLAIRLVNLGANVSIVDSLIADHGANFFNVEPIKNKINIITSDIRDRNIISRLIKEKHYIFNLAGQVSHIDSMHNPYQDLEINCTSQLSLLEACREHNPTVKIVFASTRQIYGKPKYLPMDENHVLQPIDVNGINKAAGEQYHILYSNVYGIRTCSLRLTNTYGPRQLIKHNKQGFIAWFINRLILGKKISIFGDGTQLRDLNFVDDVVEAHLLAATKKEADGEIFNLGSNIHISLEDLVKKMIKIYGKGEYELVPFPEDKKKIDIGSCYCSFDKIEKKLGWRPQVSLDEGLKKTFAYYKKNKEHYLDNQKVK